MNAIVARALALLCGLAVNGAVGADSFEERLRKAGVIVFSRGEGVNEIAAHYVRQPPFTHSDRAALLRLREILESVKVAGESCLVPLPVRFAYKGATNVCEADERDRLRSAVKNIAPRFSAELLTFWVADLDGTGQRDLLLGHVDEAGDPNFPYPYFSFWRIRFQGAGIVADFSGTFLAGSFHAVRPFGSSSRQAVFIRHQSCIECHTWIFQSIVSYPRGKAPAMYSIQDYNVNTRTKSYRGTLEYTLPGRGHSDEADVETRIMRPERRGPHFIQYFDMKKKRKEWWVFTCDDQALTCNHEMFYDALPERYRGAWKSATKL